jgi:Spy/CpxP family protein refolding chaperone
MKNKFLVLTILILLISNLVLLYFHFNKNKRRGGVSSGDFKEKMASKFKKDLGLTDEQANNLTTFRIEQREQLKPKMDSINVIKKEYMSLFFENKNMDSLKNIYAAKIGNSIFDLDISMYKQIVEARKICTPNQYNAYDSLMKKIMLRGTEKHKPLNKQ